jgi:enolase-phosphatase E1
LTRAILTDIEGTTSSLRFVKDVLFPYAAKNLPEFVREHRAEEPVREQLEATAALAGLPSHELEPLIRRLLEWIASDAKVTPLKALQGMIWKRGYESGAYQAHVYDDAVRSLREWAERGVDLFVYSSGSIQAQELFFQYSRCGDMRALFGGYFDTTSGNKHDEASYRTIAAAIGLPAEEILFLSDVEAELDAARIAGYRTGRLARPEDYGDGAGETISNHPVYVSFDDIPLDRSD